MAKPSTIGLNQVRQEYLKYFESRNHAIIPSSSLIPENDPTTLFTGSGMQPMVPYLLGESHPLGARITDSQTCFRAEDIDEVGDNRHTTFFEMLGNWSLGSYWKAQQLEWIYDFLINVIGLDPDRLYATVFSGSKTAGISQDDEAIDILQQIFRQHHIDAKLVILETEANGAKMGMQDGRIFAYDAKKNWWSRAGVPENMPVGEPGGPDSEIFYEFTSVKHDKAFGEHCHPNCDCGRFIEIGNSVFMAYLKQKDGSFTELPQKNIDFGGGLERIVAARLDNPDVFTIDVFQPIIRILEKASNKAYQGSFQSHMRIIADHLRAAAFIIAGGVEPSNKMQGYVLRRLLRRSILKARQLEIPDIDAVFAAINHSYFDYYQTTHLKSSEGKVAESIISAEVQKFQNTLNRGLKELDKHSKIDAKLAFQLLQSYGIPWELTLEIASERGQKLDKKVFEAEFQKHQERSRSASKGMFKGGLADHSTVITQYHTATHLLHQALRDVLGSHVQQMGSNITSERLRFDFKHPEKLTDDQKLAIENLINQKITDNLPVHKTIEDKDEALNSGALAFFRETYPDKVSVYTIGHDPSANWYSKELCGGPHVSSTGEIPPVRIKKEESVGSGVRRIYITF